MNVDPNVDVGKQMNEGFLRDTERSRSGASFTSSVQGKVHCCHTLLVLCIATRESVANILPISVTNTRSK
jgi:hypothetical protein